MEVSTPNISVRPGISLVWIIPLVTALVGGWLIIKTVSEQGPVATISFLTADGIEAGTTRIKYKNVNIGVVDSMEFSEDFSHVILTADFNKGTESFLRRNTRFWVVRPQLGIRGVSGLDTLVSGAYIEIEPGQGAAQLHFVGLEKPPVVLSGSIGKRIVLVASRLGSIDTGSPVYYKGILAGEVLGYELANDHQNVYVHAFIQDPYDQLIKGNTRFWNVSGMDVTVDADGLKVSTESLQSLVFGGIAFETPASVEQPAQEDDTQNLVYTLYDDHSRIQDYSYTRKIRYVAYFDNSIRGLGIGAPVEFQGIRIGSVVDYRLEYDAARSDFRIPVTFEIELERIVQSEPDAAPSSAETIAALIRKGLRARLQSGSLLTGMLFVELTMEPDTNARYVATQGDIPEMPTLISVGIDSITRSLESIVAKLDTVDIASISKELLGTLEGTNKLANSQAIHASLEDLEASMKSFRTILDALDSENLNQTITSGREVLEKLRETVDLTNNMLQPNSPMQYNVIQMTSELEETARSIRALVEMLERNPQSVLFGKQPEGE
jgi:paraquat-inducible protein B